MPSEAEGNVTNSNSARLLLGVALVAAIVSAPLPASAAEPGLGLDVVAARDTWWSAGSAVKAAAADLAAAEEQREQARATAAEAARARDREQERLSAARTLLDAARRAVSDAGGEDPAAVPDARARRQDPQEIPSGGMLEPDEHAGARIADLAERHELLAELTRSEPSDPERPERLATLEDLRDEVAAAHAEQQAVHAAAVAAAEAHGAAVDVAEADVARAQERLEVRTAEHEASLASLRGLGWRAGVPGRHGWVWPTDGAPGSRFGRRRHPISGHHRLHAGVDVPAPTGQAVVAAAAGTVTSTGRQGGYGFTVNVDHGGGRVTRYAHLSYIHVREGDRVEQSQRIGKVGSTGASTGPHLHWEVHVDGTPRDPLGSFPGG